MRYELLALGFAVILFSGCLDVDQNRAAMEEHRTLESALHILPSEQDLPDGWFEDYQSSELLWDQSTIARWDIKAHGQKEYIVGANSAEPARSLFVQVLIMGSSERAMAYYTHTVDSALQDTWDNETHVEHVGEKGLLLEYESQYWDERVRILYAIAEARFLYAEETRRGLDDWDLDIESIGKEVLSK